MWGADAVRHVMHVGMRLSEDGDGMVQRVQRSGRAERIDSYESVPGPNAATARDLGLSSGVGAPIITEGRVWGAITVLGSGPSLPASAEDRLEMFAKLVATAIANAQSRANLAALADEQAALRRVAELVARGAAAQAIFAAVATEASQLLDDQAMTLVRYEGDRELVVVASCGGPARVGERIGFEAETLPERVRREARVVRVDDYTREPDRALADSYGLAAAVAAPISVEADVWGMLTATSSGPPLAPGTEHRLQQFAELVAAALAASQARADLEALADEQTALRRIAELTAQEAPTDAVLQAVAVQASRLAGVEFGMVLRFVAPDGSSEIVALDGAPANFKLGMRASGSGDGAVHRVWRTGRATRIDDLGAMSGRWPRMASRFGFSTSAGVPILLQGALWGALIVAGREPMPPAIESHLADFAELVSTAISAAQARAELRVLADEQAALRRVAELVARGAALDEVFAAVATEASKLLGDLAAALLRYDPGDLAVAVAVCNSPAAARPAHPVGRSSTFKPVWPSPSWSKAACGARSRRAPPAHRCPPAPSSGSRSSPSSPAPRSPTPRTRRSSQPHGPASSPPPTTPAVASSATSMTARSNGSSTPSSPSSSPGTPSPPEPPRASWCKKRSPTPNERTPSYATSSAASFPLRSPVAACGPGWSRSSPTSPSPSTCA